MRAIPGCVRLVLIGCVLLGGACGETSTAGSPTFTDTSTGLTWQTVASKMTWVGAAPYCVGLSLDGLTGWRLPSVDELRGFMRGCSATQIGGSCDVSETCLAMSCRNAPCYTSCACNTGPATGGCFWPTEFGGDCRNGPGTYWSSSEASDNTHLAWAVGFGCGDLNSLSKDETTVGVMCVR